MSLMCAEGVNENMKKVNKGQIKSLSDVDHRNI